MEGYFAPHYYGFRGPDMRYLMILCFIFFNVAASAQSTLTQNEIDIRAREIGRSLRCVVCQNQSIEDSDAALAKDMRVLVREHIMAGDSDAEIVEFMRLRYGDYVLLKPPFQQNTYLLWFFPLLMILGMGVWVLKRSKNQIKRLQPNALSEEEQMILDRIMSEKT